MRRLLLLAIAAAAVVAAGCGGGAPDCEPVVANALETAEAHVRQSLREPAVELTSSGGRQTLVTVEMAGEQRKITATLRCEDGAWTVTEAQQAAW